MRGRCVACTLPLKRFEDAQKASKKRLKIDQKSALKITMNPQSICRCLIAAFLSVTASAWGQSSAALGRLDYLAHCASCHGKTGRGDGPVNPFLRSPSPDLTRIAQRHGGQFPQELVWETVDGRRLTEPGVHGSRDMPVWGDTFKAQAMTAPGDSATAAEGAAQYRITALLKYLVAIQRL